MRSSILIKKAAAVFIASITALSVTACLPPWLRPPVQESSAPQTSEASSAPSGTAAPSSAPSETTTPSPSKEPSPTPEEPGSDSPADDQADIWALLGEDAEGFAKNFSADDITVLEYTFYGVGGAEIYTTKDSAFIKDVFNSLCEIKILEETPEEASDYDDVFRFNMKNGDYAVRFNMHNLNAGGHYYKIENDDALWYLANALKEQAGSDEPSGNTADEPDGSEKTPAEPTEEPAAESNGSEKEPDEPAEEPAPSKNSTVHTAGQWTYTEDLLQNGDIEYCLNDTVVLDIPGTWIGKVSWMADGDTFGFYHDASYNNFMEKYGYPGGHLFSVVWVEDESYEELPSYQYIGPAAPNGSYIMVFPTDVQAYTDDKEITDEYMSLYEDVKTIRKNVYSKL